MVTTIVTESNTGDIAEMIQSRAERGRQLYLTSRQLIVKVDEETYTVPSSARGGSYTVRYGGKVEECSCADYQTNRGLVACQHSPP